MFAVLEGVGRDGAHAVRKDDLLKPAPHKGISPKVLKARRQHKAAQVLAPVKDKFPKVRYRLRDHHFLDLAVPGKELVQQDGDRFSAELSRHQHLLFIPGIARDRIGLIVVIDLKVKFLHAYSSLAYPPVMPQIHSLYHPTFSPGREPPD